MIQTIHVLVTKTLYTPEERAGPVAVVIDGMNVRAVWRVRDVNQAKQLCAEQLPGELVEVSDLGTWRIAPGSIDIHAHGFRGDKPAPYLDMPAEMNPFLGVRGLRLSLAHPEVFQGQLRALLRAGAGHHVKIMFPMVATRAEVLAAREQIASARAALVERGADVTQKYEVGIMVEVPSAALLAESLAGVVDFFSIGTNDLSQYTLAADRTNAAVAPLADALHPAVLHLIRMVIEAAHAHGKWVGLCGELAGDPLAVPILLGLGLDEFSMTARSIPLVKQVIRRYTVAQAREIAQHALALSDATEVRTYLQQQTAVEQAPRT